MQKGFIRTSSYSASAQKFQECDDSGGCGCGVTATALRSAGHLKNVQPGTAVDRSYKR